MKGLFISFEGPDGVGKTTQTKLLCERLRALSHEVTMTREPGGTPLGAVIRRWFLEQSVTWEAEVLLMAADRAQHLDQVIVPALQEQHIVICDRYVDSSLVYQGWAAEQSMTAVWEINKVATRGLLPDVTFLLLASPQACYRRLQSLDAIERRGPEFQQKVYDGYVNLAQQTPRMLVLDVEDQTEEEVAIRIWDHCLQRWPWLAQQVN